MYNLALRVLCGLVSVLLLQVGKPVLAVSPKIVYFLETLKGSDYDYPFIRKGLEAVERFVSSAEGRASYHPYWNTMTLPDYLYSEEGNVKSIHEMTQSEIDSIIHESFHAYKAKRMTKEEHDWMRVRANLLLERMGGSEYARLYVLEEAYASFLAQYGAVRKTVQDVFENMTNDRVCNPKRISRMKKFWELQWTEQVLGYESGERTVYIPITKVDKFWLQETYLNNNLRVPFEELFEKELAVIRNDCSQEFASY